MPTCCISHVNPDARNLYYIYICKNIDRHFILLLSQMSCSCIHILFLRTFTKRVFSLPTRCWLPSSCTKQLVPQTWDVIQLSGYPVDGQKPAPLDILHIKNTGNDYNSGAASPYAQTMRKLRTHNARLRDSRSFSTKYGSFWTHLSATSLATGKWWLCHWNRESPRFIGSNLVLLHPSLQWHSLCKTSSKVAWPHHLGWLSWCWLARLLEMFPFTLPCSPGTNFKTLYFSYPQVLLNLPRQNQSDRLCESISYIFHHPTPFAKKDQFPQTKKHLQPNKSWNSQHFPHIHHIHQESRTLHPLTKTSQFPNNGGKYRPSPTRNVSQIDVIPKTPLRHWDPQVRWSPQHPTGSPREGGLCGLFVAILSLTSTNPLLSTNWEGPLLSRQIVVAWGLGERMVHACRPSDTWHDEQSRFGCCYFTGETCREVFNTFGKTKHQKMKKLSWMFIRQRGMSNTVPTIMVRMRHEWLDVPLPPKRGRPSSGVSNH